MPRNTPPRRSIAKIIAIDLGLFLAFDVFYGTTTYAVRVRRNPDARWIDSFTEFLPFWLLMAAFAPLIFAITRRHRIGLGRGVQPVLVHVGLMFAWLPLFSLMWVAVAWLDDPTAFPGFAASFSSRWLLALTDVQWYWLLAMAAHAYYGARDVMDRARETAVLQLENAELAGRLARAELDSLKAQLQPHFLFNTHHAIAGLIRSEQPAAALALLTNLGDLLRYALQTKSHALVPLRRELEFTRAYLAIQRARFGGRLEVSEQVDAACLDVDVPTLLLQPLIENAVHHGVSGDRERNHIHLEGHMDRGYLELQIRNSTVPDAADHAGFGIGLRNVHARLDRLYGEAYSLELELVAPDEMQLRMRLPTAEVA